MTQRMIQRCHTLLAKPFFHDRRTILALWLLLSLVGMLKLHRSDNNFLIFRGVFWHTIQGLPLYEAYPAEYFDVNHYGPLFSLVIAPFAVMPVGLGMFFWLVALSLTLYFAIRCSGLTDGGKLFVFWFCSETLLTSLFMQQFNIAIAAIIIATFFLVERERDFWAACLIVVGTLVKLYGIVGLAFFLFSRHKVRFTLSLVFWAVVLFAAPMLISSPQYVVGQYGEWVACLGGKNVENIHSIAQNISALGLVRRITDNTIYSDLWLILPALTVFFLPYLRLGQYGHAAFRQTLLASVLLFVVLFSTGSESSSYIIALCGASIWYVAAPWKRNRWDVGLMVFVFLLSSMGSSDLYPREFKREVIQQYALKALPCLLVWLKLCWEMLRKDYASPDSRPIR